MRATGPIPAVAAASVLCSAAVGGFVANIFKTFAILRGKTLCVLYSAAVGGSDVGVVGPLSAFGELNSCELGVFRF